MSYESSRDSAFEEWVDQKYEEKVAEFVDQGLSKNDAQVKAQDWADENDTAFNEEFTEEFGHAPYS